MRPYVCFIERDVVFTPSAMNNRGEHVAINIVTPNPFQRQRQHNTDTGRHEIAVHISPNFEGKFWVIISVGRKTSQKIWIEVEVEDGIITDIITIDGHPEKSGPVDIKLPSGEWANSVYEWHRYPINFLASAQFVWLP